MKRYQLLLLAVASAPLLIHAQPVRTAAVVTDGNVAVPQLKYQSAFSEYKPVVAVQPTPDKVWVRANQDVADKSPDDASENMSMQMNHAPAAKEKPAAAPVADPHMGHDMNMKGH